MKNTKNMIPTIYKSLHVSNLDELKDLYKNWNDYETTWQSAESKGLKFFYNISRENVGLTLQANSLLESN